MPQRLRRLRDSWRAHPLVFDTLLALALALLSVPALWWRNPELDQQPHPPDTLGVALTLLACLPLALRRRAPLPVLGIIVGSVQVLVLLSYSPGGVELAPLIAVYTVATCCRQTVALRALVVVVALSVALVPFGRPAGGGADAVAQGVLCFAAWAFGRSVRLRRAYVAELELRAERLERAREADLRAVVAEERTRIARELHDVVAHSLSVMTVQAAAAQRTLDRSPARSREAMAAVESTGRAALGEMRRMVGVLRSTGDADGPGELAPQPGTGDLPALVAQVREAGLPVDLQVRGAPVPLPAGVDLVAYRLVQEALTNVLKHAGRATARVLMDYRPGELLLRVVDDGRGAAADLAAADAPAGHGLPGMQERVALYGGQVVAGPRPGGGYEVRARLPFGEQEPPVAASVPVSA